ncbi:hypothetical protein SAMN05421595_2869 [Austwickia chelonae]|uniref:Uncharacterized protein n=1 Tax=Austwickia chelonae NBRC 105200 TaxID=1184607 RepID=K6WB22_9MICO|nr:YeeE/YedE family protein [Austwickia chelonae]GAB79007.1 hypothetical protein AUCHE_18_00080 [Austwickia chelonae NBRC 105200]SEW41610.1 hypothetical protein SAMN05421595_2869 [Austwickia chelonae]
MQAPTESEATRVSPDGNLDRTLRPLPPFRNRHQPLIGAGVIIAAFLLGLLAKKPETFALYMGTGLALGYILTRSRFGFAGGVKRIYMTGEGSLSKALLLTFAIAAIVTAGIHWAAVQDGAVAAWNAGRGDKVIPGTQVILEIGLPLILGGVIFGAGMIMAGGCASGTLADLGEGAVRVLFSLPFFILGSIPGHWLRAVMTDSPVGTGVRVYLPDHLGYSGAVIATLLGLMGLWILVRRYEQYRKREGYYQVEQWDADERYIPQEDTGKPFRFFSARTYHHLMVTRWDFRTGGILLAFMFLFILITTKKSWGVTSAFTVWAVAFLDLFGVHITHPSFASINASAAGGLLNHSGSVRDVGIIFGSACALLLAGRFRLDTKFSKVDAFTYAVGGLFMGIGARLAGGCNIGALFSGIGNLSLSGWVFGVALFAGGILALKFFHGRINLVGPERHTLPPNYPPVPSVEETSGAKDVPASKGTSA